MANDGIRIDSAAITDVGKKRKGNEDAYYFDDDKRLYVVADGMGGHKAGEVASRIVVETIQDKMSQPGDSIEGEGMVASGQEISPEAFRLLSSIHLANEAVYLLSSNKEEFKGMGSTVSAVMFNGTHIIAANVGDSPIYLIRGQKIDIISTLHTYAAEHAALAGANAKPLAAKYQHMITRAMGVKEKVDPSVHEVPARTGDIILICSDGLSDLVKPAEIMTVVLKYKPEKAVKALVGLANKRGGVDNITIVMAHLLAHPEAGQQKQKTAAVTAEPSSVSAVFALPVDVDTEDASHHTSIEHLTTTGGHIKTTDAYTVGEEIELTFPPTPDGHSLILSATVSNRDPSGINITFDELTEEQETSLKALIESMA